MGLRGVETVRSCPARRGWLGAELAAGGGVRGGQRALGGLHGPGCRKPETGRYIRSNCFWRCWVSADGPLCPQCL